MGFTQAGYSVEGRRWLEDYSLERPLDDDTDNLKVLTRNMFLEHSLRVKDRINPVTRR